MKVAICAKSNLGMNADVDDRFGRAEYYVLFDTENKETSIIENSAKNDSAGAGGKAISLLNKQNVDVILVPELGPKALDAVNAFELKAYHLDGSKTVEAALHSFLEGKLTQLATSSVGSHNGLRKA